jgi:hypothetical protein
MRRALLVLFELALLLGSLATGPGAAGVRVVVVIVAAVVGVLVVFVVAVLAVALVDQRQPPYPM